LRHAARSTWRIAAFTSCTAAGERKRYIERVASVPLLIIDDLVNTVRQPPPVTRPRSDLDDGGGE
jgi:hypothetical protein